MSSPVPKIHFVGIGGIGMSALAQWFAAQGYEISGSDQERHGVVDEIELKLGIRIRIGYDPGAIQTGLERVVHTQQQSPEENPELRRAAELGIPCQSYQEAIGELTRRYETLAVAGAHGKSTTTALLALILAEAGLDPTVIVGTKVKEFGGNFRQGGGEYLVLEADEYKGAFLHYSPARSIITNIDLEHLDYYRDLDEIESAFLNYAHRVSKSLVLNADDPRLTSLRRRLEDLSARRGLALDWYSLADPEAEAVRAAMRVFGEHNASNALAAMHLARTLGVSDEVALRVFRRYEGAWRRMEFRGKFEGADVYDDYAHHPTEIRATLAALRSGFPDKKIICVFQPHQAIRLAKLFPGFQEAFADAHETLILPLYRVAGRDEDTGEFTSEALVREIQKREPKKPLFYLADPKKLPEALRTLGSLPNKVIVMMGAGDIVRLTDNLLAFPAGSGERNTSS